MTDTTPTCLWNDLASLQKLGYALDHGAVEDKRRPPAHETAPGSSAVRRFPPRGSSKVMDAANDSLQLRRDEAVDFTLHRILSLVQLSPGY